MKQYKILIIISLLFIFAMNEIKAESQMHLGFSAGLAIPNEKVSQFFNDSKQFVPLDSIGVWGNYFLEKATSIGYKLKIYGRIDLSNNFTFVPSIGLSRFNEGKYDLIIPIATDTITAITQSTTNIVPISVGINGYLFRKFLSPYINVDLVYNYINYSCDIVLKESIAIPVVLPAETMHRLGYSIGVGLDIDISLVSLNLEAKFNAANIIKYEDNEPQKNYFTFMLGIIF